MYAFKRPVNDDSIVSSIPLILSIDGPMNKTDAGTFAVRPNSRRARWRRVLLQNRAATRSARRRLALIVVPAIALVVPVVIWLRETPKVEPRFEQMGLEGAGPVKEFALRDARGALHTNEEWAGRPGIVLFFIATECPVSNSYAPEMARLAKSFEARGFVFRGIHTDPAVTAALAAAHADEYGLPFPILLDPAQTVARQAGVRVTPEAVVLLPDGQIVYRGRIDDRYSPDGRHRPAAVVHELENAIAAILRAELPVVVDTKPFGCPLVPREETGRTAETITFAQHVAPILWNNCSRCHRPGEVGPFSLLTYKDAAKRAEFIRDVTANGSMPPWKPHAGAGVFQDAARLSVLEKETLKVWAETGCSPGDLTHLPAPPRFAEGWQLNEPDVVLTMPEPMDVPADGPDLYRAFAMPFPLDRDATIVGVEFRPGDRRIVHHARIHVDTTGDARRRDRTEAGAGFSGWFGGPVLELPYPGIGAWTPGMTARLAPDGVGRVIPRGSDIAIEVHYHPVGKPTSDRSSVGLFFAKKPTTKTMSGYSLSTDRIDIPAGEKRHRIIQSTRLKADVHLYTVVPHAHYLCREFRLAATLPDGTVQALLWITDWDLDWQDQYRYAKPVRLPKGTVLTLAAYFDNTQDNPRNPNRPPRRVRYGVGTHDEMCACHLEFLPDDTAGYKAYQSKSPFGL
jgi:peroxiredoxin